MSEPFPLFGKLLLELQANCNRTCFFCPRTGDQSGQRFTADGRPRTDALPTDVALRVLDEAAEIGFRGLVSFHHLSEPLLDPRWPEMARAARSRGLRVYEHSNGDVLRQRPDLWPVVAALVEYLVIGIYDVSAPADVAGEQTFWREALKGADVRFSVVGEGTADPRALVPSDPRTRRQKQSRPTSPCADPLLRMIVHYDGEMALCCEDMLNVHKLGNVRRSHLRDLWFSERHQEIALNLLAGRRDLYPGCRFCPAPATVVPTAAALLSARE